MKTKYASTIPIRVAVAIIRHQDRFLLATRHAHQHQGGKLEFVGGKIEQGESPASALVREVAEELDLKLQTDQLVYLGRIQHDYSDKSVQLHIYQAYLNDGQYDEFKNCTHGTEGQSLHWLDLPSLLMSGEQLPAANLPILRWLSLPDTITISRSLSQFDTADEFARFYIDHLPEGAWFYFRPQSDIELALSIYHAITAKRGDLQMIVGDALYAADPALFGDAKVKLSAKTLKRLATAEFDLERVFQTLADGANHDVVFLAGVHDAMEVQRVNALAKRARIAAAFVSPVLVTQSHPDAAPLGWSGLRDLVHLLDVPGIALGGISKTDLTQAKDNGAVAVAGISNFL